MSAHPHVLIVDDEPDLANLYASWLSDEYIAETANDGSRALERFDDSVEVVLLDRRMPGLSGDETLERIRNRRPGCPVAMITAVDPDFDILEMGFDAYLTKPVERETIRNVVERLLRRSEYTETLRQFFVKLSKREALESEKSRVELQSDERYQKLQSDIKTLQRESEEHLAELEDEDFEALFYRLDA